MTGSVHAAVGAALGRYIENRPLAFLAGVASHLVGDVVPHHEMGLGEVPVMLATFARIVQRHGWDSPQFWGAFGGIAPDLEHIPYELKKDPRRHEPMEEKYFPTHNNQLAHGTWPLDAKWGVAMQVALFLGALYLAGTLTASNE